MFVARPLAVIASSIGTGLKWNELALLSWIAPRGIVAAAVSALFSLKLEEIGYEGAGIIVPMVFLVIIATVVVQSLTSRSVASLLKVRAPRPPVILFLVAVSLIAYWLAKCSIKILPLLSQIQTGTPSGKPV